MFPIAFVASAHNFCLQGFHIRSEVNEVIDTKVQLNQAPVISNSGIHMSNRIKGDALSTMQP